MTGGDVSIVVRWLGHATVLLELPGLTVLTDPFLRDRLGPLRRHGPPVDADTLRDVDVVLISHAHPDHFDASSLARLGGDPRLLVPRNMGQSIRRMPLARRFDELEAGDAVEIGEWRITAVRARHWRWPFQPATRTIGFVIDGPIAIWFAGDTAPYRGMGELSGRIDLALLPIGRWGPQPTPGHLTPASAADVVALVRPSVVVPIHWGTLYPAGLHRVLAGPLREPAARFREALGRVAPEVGIAQLEPGAQVELALRARRRL